ncbi:MAG: hypothetical protein R3E99_13630 [Burkholderiaceae bacterium]
MSQGNATYTMRFKHWRSTPQRAGSHHFRSRQIRPTPARLCRLPSRGCHLRPGKAGSAVAAGKCAGF